MNQFFVVLKYGIDALMGFSFKFAVRTCSGTCLSSLEAERKQHWMSSLFWFRIQKLTNLKWTERLQEIPVTAPYHLFPMRVWWKLALLSTSLMRSYCWLLFNGIKLESETLGSCSSVGKENITDLGWKSVCRLPGRKADCWVASSYFFFIARKFPFLKTNLAFH